MNPLPMVLASLRRFPLVSLATLLLVAVAVGLGTAVSLLEPSLRREPRRRRTNSTCW